MTGHRLEVADVFRDHGLAFLDEFGDALSPEQRRVLSDLAACRTAALGGHVEACDRCGHQRISYNSCRNRHCPKCQGTAAAQWLDARATELLPTEYFHVVFTLPEAIGSIALQNPRVVYGILFHAAAETLLQVAADPKHLGAEIGLLAVLHTWGQNLHHHPHVHCVVPGGGLSPEGSRWISCPTGFFLPVRVLSRVFRGKFLARLRAAFDEGKLAFHGQQSALSDAGQFQRQLVASAKTDWVVYAKPPFGGPEQVLKYLAQYTHRVAITNRRLIDVEEGQVRFRTKDYTDDGRPKAVTLHATEFIRRFLLHVLPSGFVRIRHYGFLSNRLRQEKLALCRELLHVTPMPELVSISSSAELSEEMVGPSSVKLCPSCGVGHMVIIDPLVPTGGQRGEEPCGRVPVFDTS